jgi:CDP-diglyceride synthetase
MKALSCVVFAGAGCLGGVVGEIWQMHRDPRYSPDFGMEGAVIGLALFAALYAAVILVYGAASQIIRAERALAAPVLSALVGFPFWFVILPLHSLLRDRLGLPDGVWWFEAALLCAVSFELIRLLKTRMA